MAATMIQKRYETTTRPASGAMDLNSGKPDAKQAAMSASFTLGAILCMGMGALVFSWSIPKSEFGQIQWNAFNVVGIVTGSFVVFFAFRYAWSMGNITVVLWEDYLTRLRDWHKAELWAYTKQDGVETMQAVSIYEYSANVAYQAFVTALLIQYRLTHNKSSVLPYSVRGLEDPLQLSSGNNLILMGELKGTQPERMSERLADLGYVTNRKPGYAGDWQPQSYEDIIETFARNWSKIKGISRE